MPAQISYTSFDHAPVTIVPVIASFDSEGHIRPLYIRIGEEPLKVHSFWVKPTFVNLIEFKCKVIDGDCLKPLAITYHQAECVWTIPKRWKYS